MTRISLIRSDFHPYHVVNRSLHQLPFALDLDQLYKILIEELYVIHKQHQLGIHGFILMNNHFHLLCHTPLKNLDQVMHQFLLNTSKRCGRITNHRVSFWDGHYKWTLIDNQTYYYQVYRYIYQNPLRAGVVSRVEDYPFSTLTTEPPFPLHSFVPMSFGGHEGELHWLNEKYDPDDEKLIKLGLRKFQFDVSKRRLKAFNKLSVPKDS